MPRYLFTVADGEHHIEHNSRDFADLPTAKCQAVKFASELICEAHESFWDRGDWEMTVADATGLTLFTLVFAGYEAAALAC